MPTFSRSHNPGFTDYVIFTHAKREIGPYIHIHIYGAEHEGYIKGVEYTDLADQLQASQMPCAVETLIRLLGRSVS